MDAQTLATKSIYDLATRQSNEPITIAEGVGEIERRITALEADATASISSKALRAIGHILDHLKPGAYFSIGRRCDDMIYEALKPEVFWVQLVELTRSGNEDPVNYEESKTWHNALRKMGLMEENGHATE